MSNISNTVRISGIGELVAAIPHLLGFYPAESVVIAGMHAEPARSPVMMRADLADPHLHERCDALLAALREHDATRVVITIVTAEHLAHRDLVRAFQTSFAAAGVATAEAVWVPQCTAGAPWISYHTDSRQGAVPDPQNSTVAAANAYAGRRTYPARDDIAAEIRPVDQVVLRRRADLVDRELLTYDFASQHNLDAISIAQSATTLRDRDYARLAIALTDPAVRDHYTALALTEDGNRAVAFWTRIVSQLPAPERAHAASMLAMTAYLNGDGVRANLAVQAALASDSDNVMASIMRTALENATSPARLREALHRAL